MPHQRSDDKAQPEEPENQVVPFYKSIDPWAPSIYRSINNRRPNDIRDIDDVELPRIQFGPPFLRSDRSQPQYPPFFQLPPSNRQATFSRTPDGHIPEYPQQKTGPPRLSGPPTVMPHSRPWLQLPAPPSPPPAVVRRIRAISWGPNNDQERDTPDPSPVLADDGKLGLFGPASPPLPAVSLKMVQLNKNLPAIPIEYTSRPLPVVPTPPTPGQSLELQEFVFAFLADVLPRQIYLHCLLRLPSLYFSRVDRIFMDADLTLGEIKDMALRVTAEDSKTLQAYMFNLESDVQTEVAVNVLPPSYRRLRDGWENFIDGLIKEWKTLNIVSGLLVTAILTVFQIEAASGDPVTRYIAMWSLLCALMSLLYGCSYIIRFSPMRKAYKAAEWALEARKHQTIIWNVWVMLALPVIWLAWSIITFILCIVAFMWRSSAITPANFTFSVATSIEFYFRIFLCIVLCIGVMYGILISGTFRKYGQKMDQAWKRRVEGFIGGAISLPTYVTQSRSVTATKLSPRPKMPQVPNAQSKLATPRSGWHKFAPPKQTRAQRIPPDQAKAGWQSVEQPRHEYAWSTPPPSPTVNSRPQSPTEEHRATHTTHSRSMHSASASRGPLQQFTTTHIPPQYTVTTYIPSHYMTTSYLDGPLSSSLTVPIQSVNIVHAPPATIQPHHPPHPTSFPSRASPWRTTRKGSVTVEDVTIEENDGILGDHHPTYSGTGDNVLREIISLGEDDGPTIGSPSQIVEQDEQSMTTSGGNGNLGSENRSITGRSGDEQDILEELWPDERLQIIDNVVPDSP